MLYKTYIMYFHKIVLIRELIICSNSELQYRIVQ